MNFVSYPKKRKNALFIYYYYFTNIMIIKKYFCRFQNFLGKRCVKGQQNLHLSLQWFDMSTLG